MCLKILKRDESGFLFNLFCFALKFDYLINIKIKKLNYDGIVNKVVKFCIFFVKIYESNISFVKAFIASLIVFYCSTLIY